MIGFVLVGIVIAAGASAAIPGLGKGRVWPLGIALFGGAALLVYLLFSLWPTRVSDLPEGETVACTSPVPSPMPIAANNGKTPPPTPTPTPTPTPAPTPTASPVSSATASADPRTVAMAAQAEAQRKDPWLRCARVFGRPVPVPFEIRLLIIVALAAGLGSFVHVATSFSGFLGNGTYDPRWLWWYILRLPVGIALANVFYFAIRGGILTSTSLSTSDINPFGIAALAGLVGLFSKQASDKLEETFKSMFKTEAGSGDDKRTGKMDSLDPAIISVTPATLEKGKPPSNNQLAVSGANFKDKVVATIGEHARDFKRIDDRNLTVTLIAADYAEAGPLKLTITNATDKATSSVSEFITVTDGADGADGGAPKSEPPPAPRPT